MTWAEIWNGVVNFFTTSGLTILKGIGLWIIGYIVVKIMVLIIKKIFSKTKIERVTQGFLLSVIKFVLYVILVIMVLQQFGVEITGLVATLAAAGLAVSLALQNSLANVASGIVLLVNQPFKEGDYVSVCGVEGKVQNIRILTTTLTTYDNKLVVLPNSSVANNPIVNYSMKKLRRVEYTFSIDYQVDPDLVKQVVTDAMKSDGRVQLKPAPFCSIKSFGEDGLEFFCHCWCASEDYWDVYYYVIDNVFNEFKRNKITIPYKQLEVRLRDDKVVYPYREEKKVRSNEKIVQLEEEETIESFFKNWDKEGKKRRLIKKEKKQKEKEEKLKKLAEKNFDKNKNQPPEKQSETQILNENNIKNTEKSKK